MPIACGAPEPGQLPSGVRDDRDAAVPAPAPPVPMAEVAPPAIPAPPPAPSPPPAAGAAVEPAAPTDAVPLDLGELERKLRDTRALGPLTKLALKNDIDDLVADVRAFHAQDRGELSRLRERFELLVMKLLSLLQDREAELAAQIARSRDGLWSLLSDPRALAQLSEKK